MGLIRFPWRTCSDPTCGKIQGCSNTLEKASIQKNQTKVSRFKLELSLITLTESKEQNKIVLTRSITVKLGFISWMIWALCAKYSEIETSTFTNLQERPGANWQSSVQELWPVLRSGTENVSVITPSRLMDILESDRGFSKATLMRSMVWCDGIYWSARRAKVVQSNPPEKSTATVGSVSWDLR